jgi:hypothetical protein
MKDQTKIPEDTYKYLAPFLQLTDSFGVVDEKSHSLVRWLERDHLREWLGDRRDLFIPALKWAIQHPDIDYHARLPDEVKHEFTNQDCVKLFTLALRSLEHLHDEGPDVIGPATFYINTPGDLDA